MATIFAAERELARELGRRRIAIGLIGRVERVAKAASVACIEGDRHIVGLFALEQVAQEARKAVERMRRLAIGIGQIGWQRIPGAEDVDRSVDQVDH